MKKPETDVTHAALDRALHHARTDKVISAIHATGEAFFRGTTWRGLRAIRVSVANWRTTAFDVERTVAAVAAVLRGR